MRRLILLPVFFALAACDWEDFDHSARYTTDFHHSYPLQPGGRLSLENFNGSVEISGWEQNTVDISGVKYGPTPELRDAIKIDIVPTSNSISIRTVRPVVERRGNMGARFVIRVPRKTQVDRVISSNGAVKAIDLDGEVRVKTSNGSVRAANLRGDLDAQTSNGSVEVDNVEGSAAVKTSNGRVHAERVTGGFEAYTSNGSISADISAKGAGRPIRVGTSNGSVELRMEAANANEVRASTTNGGITLRLPSTVNARVRAHTSNSSISTDFPVQTEGATSKNHLEGMIGRGGPTLDLSTSNGNIRLLKL